MLADIKCGYCDSLFRPRLRRSKYCSQECFKLSRKPQLKLCAACQKPFRPWSREKAIYCSRSCSVRANNNKKGRRIHICKNCQTEFNPRHRSLLYCSQECYREFHYLAFIERWKRGEETGNEKNVGTVRPYVRRYIKDKFGNKCCQCGWAEVHSVTGKVPVQIDHIDGDWRNSREENLRLLCPNCHSLTPTYGTLNMKNGSRGRNPSLDALRKSDRGVRRLHHEEGA